MSNRPAPPLFWRPDAPTPGTVGRVPPVIPAPSLAVSPAERAADGPPDIDYDVVRTLQAAVSDQVSEQLRGREVSPAEQRALIEDETRRRVREHVDHRVGLGEHLPADYEPALATAVTAYLLGLGRLQPLIDDPEVENIHVLGHDRVRVEYAGGRIDETSFTAAGSDAELIELLQRLAARGGTTERALSTAKPVLHLRLPDGSRMVAAHVVTPRPVVVIRRHRIRKATLDDLAAAGSLTPLLARFLRAAVRGNLNVMIAGLAGVGKTHLLRACLEGIPREEWWATMETDLELQPDPDRHPWAVAFEERQGHGEIGVTGRPEGELALTELFPDMLRMNVQRVVVGEIRAAEVVSMFDAGATTQGTLSTIHARHPDGVFNRLAYLLIRHGASPNPQGAYMQIVDAVDLVVYQSMNRQPGARSHRYVSHVLEVNGLAEGGLGVARSELFAPRVPGGVGEPTRVRPRKRVLDALAAAGFDPTQLTDANTVAARR